VSSTDQNKLRLSRHVLNQKEIVRLVNYSLRHSYTYARETAQISIPGTYKRYNYSLPIRHVDQGK